MAESIDIPYNRPHVAGTELEYVREAVARGHLSGNGHFARLCAAWLEEHVSSARALMTPSCTAALELAIRLIGVGPGDEVIMPSFTFVSTASAVVLAGGVPVFVDIREDTLNIDERRLAEAITGRTKAILVVHYAGVACEMDAILELAAKHGLSVVEDAAQAILSGYRGRALGGIGSLGALSFHETKNVQCGEGGALLVNDPLLVERAEILQEKGTNRARFFRGQVDKYTWVDLGSSYLLSDLAAAFLWAQIQAAEALTARRRALWSRYHAAFESLEADGLVRRPVIPASCDHNAHLYYLLLPDERRRDGLIAALREQGIQAVFHYVPLHSSPAGSRLGRAAGDLTLTTSASARLVRLPMWVDMPKEASERVIAVTRSFLELPAAAAHASFSAR